MDLAGQKAQYTTPPIPNDGLRVFRSLPPGSNFVSVDNDALRKPLLGMVVTVFRSVIRLHCSVLQVD
jgi:hypothetical protein